MNNIYTVTLDAGCYTEGWSTMAEARNHLVEALVEDGRHGYITDPSGRTFRIDDAAWRAWDAGFDWATREWEAHPNPVSTGPWRPCAADAMPLVDVDRDHSDRDALAEIACEAARTQWDEMLWNARKGLPSMARTWSAYQTAIFDFVRSGTGNGCVMARAGCAKTTTAVEATRLIPQGKKTGIFAFNYDNAVELRAKVADGVEARTFNSLGARVFNATYPRARKNEDKVRDAIKRVTGSTRWSPFLTAADKAVRLAKATLAKDTPEAILEIVDRYDLDWSDPSNPKANPNDPRQRADFAQVVLSSLQACLANTAEFDFDDQIWIPVKQKMRVPQYDLSFIDEAQDTNRMQMALIWMASRDRVVVIGDDRQAIYSFRGADPRAFQVMQDTFRTKLFPLTTTYRCPRLVVELAQVYVPDYECGPGAPDGSVTRCAHERVLDHVRPGDFVISRSNAPLISLCLQAIRRGIPATVKGRDIGQELRTFLTAGERALGACCTKPEFTAWINAWAEQEIHAREAAGRSSDVISDKRDAVLALWSFANTISEAKERLEGIFGDAAPQKMVTFLTTHKAKGMERERCFVLESTYRPKVSTEEANMWYVAITRTKRELVLVDAPITQEAS